MLSAAQLRTVYHVIDEQVFVFVDFVMVTLSINVESCYTFSYILQDDPICIELILDVIGIIDRYLTWSKHSKAV